MTLTMMGVTNVNVQLGVVLEHALKRRALTSVPTRIGIWSLDTLRRGRSLRTMRKPVVQKSANVR